MFHWGGVGVEDTHRDLNNDERRSELNRIVRVFASQIGLDDDALSAAVKTMLREVGEVLGIDYATFIELADDGQATTASRYWHWSTRPAGKHPFDPPALQSIIQQVKPKRDPMILTEGE